MQVFLLLVGSPSQRRIAMRTETDRMGRMVHVCEICSQISYRENFTRACEKIGMPPMMRSPRSLLYITCRIDPSGNETFRLLPQGGQFLNNGEVIVRGKIQEIRTRGCAWGGKSFELRHFTEYLCRIPPRKTRDEESLILIPDYTTIVRGYFDLN